MAAMSDRSQPTMSPSVTVARLRTARIVVVFATRQGYHTERAIRACNGGLVAAYFVLRMDRGPKPRAGTASFMDLILSSGFLAFARHIGVLKALRARGLAIDAVVGTSSGAVVGALWAAGYSVADIQALLRSRAPYTLMRPSPTFWRGALSLSPFEAFLRQRLPAGFDDLQRPLALGVMTAEKRHALLTEGDLTACVVASVSMPWVFNPATVNGQRYWDGGAVDRLGFSGWKRWRPDRSVIVHRVRRSAGVDLRDDLSDALLIETPRSGATFFSLGDFDAQVAEAEAAALASLPYDRAEIDPLADESGCVFPF